MWVWGYELALPLLLPPTLGFRQYDKDSPFWGNLGNPGLLDVETANLRLLNPFETPRETSSCLIDRRKMGHGA